MLVVSEKKMQGQHLCCHRIPIPSARRKSGRSDNCHSDVVSRSFLEEMRRNLDLPRVLSVSSRRICFKYRTKVLELSLFSGLA